MRDHEGPDNDEQLFSETQAARISRHHSLLFLLLSGNFMITFSSKFKEKKPSLIYTPGSSSQLIHW